MTVLKKLFFSFCLLLLIPVVSYADQTIVDNGDNVDGRRTSFVGTWYHANAPGFYGVESLFCEVADSSYTFEADVTGTQEVSMWWTEKDCRGTAIPIEIYDGDTLIDTVEIDQTTNGGHWNVLGSYAFTGTARVTIPSTGDHSTSADAVMFDDAAVLIPVNVTFTWEYTEDPEVNEAGFVIRANEQELTDVPGGEVRTFQKDFMLPIGENKFEIKTCDVDGLCSIWSEPAFLTVSEETTIACPINLSVTKTPQ